jgi:hypothetical protein
MRQFILVVIAALHSTCISAQSYSTTRDVDIKMFMMDVKNIDEFIERFNNDSSSYSLKEYKKWLGEQVKLRMNPQTQSGTYDSLFALITSRPQLLKSLFNWQNQLLIQDTVLPLFFNDVADSAAPKFIRGRSPEWYAETECHFSYKEQSVVIPIILHVRAGQGRKWMITGIGDNPLFNNEEKIADATDTTMPVINNSIPFTNSAMNFPEFAKIFNASLNQHNYFEADLLKTDKAKKFIQLIKQEQLKHLYVGEMRFHFYQIPGWAFTVEEIHNNPKSSNWLINNVKKVSDDEKRTIKQALLQRQM